MIEPIDFLIIIKKILEGVIFPPIVVMLVFMFINVRKVSATKNLPFRFGIYLFVMLFLVKLVLTLQGSMTTLRYCYDLIFPAIVISIPGLYFGTDFLSKVLGKFKAINKKTIFFILTLSIIISCMGKAFSPPSLKPSTEQLIQIMKRETNNKPFTLITEYEPLTFKYLLKNSNVLDLNVVYNPNHPEYFNYALDHVKRFHKCPVFIAIKSKDSDFRLSFETSGIKFPITLIKEVHDKKNYYSLYIYR